MTRPSRRQRLALVVLVLVSITFVTLDFRVGGGPLAGARAAVTGLAGPAQRAVAGAASPLLGAVRGIGDLTANRARVQTLERENADLERRLGDATLNKDRSAQLSQLGLLAGRGGYTVMPGRVVALGPATGFEWTATVDVGSRDGVHTGQTVVDGDGLVGRITAVTPFTAEVLLAIDPVSAVGSRLAGSGELGITRGAGRGSMRLQLLDGQAPLQVGDRLVTGPYGATTYAPGVPIGRVSKIGSVAGGLVRTAEVTPAVDFTALDVVGVVVEQPRTDPRDRMVPAQPSPSDRP